jgi:hypothetical protein
MIIYSSIQPVNLGWISISIRAHVKKIGDDHSPSPVNTSPLRYDHVVLFPENISPVKISPLRYDQELVSPVNKEPLRLVPVDVSQVFVDHVEFCQVSEKAHADHIIPGFVSRGE